MPHLSSLAKHRRHGSTAIACALVLAPLTAIAETKKVTYEDHLRPLLENKCFSCHNPDKAKGGLDLTTYSSMMAGGSGGELVVSGQPADSRLFRSISHLEEPQMPPEGGMLPKDKLDLVEKWISGGLLETSNSKAKKAAPSMSIALAAPSTGKPEGPPPMPDHLLLEPVVTTGRAFAPADITSSPWAPLIAIAAPHQLLLYNTDTLRLAGILPFPEGFPQNISFSRNGQIVIAGGGRGGKLGRVVGWDVKTGQRVFEIGNEFDSVLAADLSADHSLVALGGPSRKVRVFDTNSGEQLLEMKKHTDWITSLSFSPDGVLLASGDRNGNLFVVEAGTGNLFYTLKGHTKAITAVSWRADSNVLASASEDGSVRLWEMNGGKQIKTWTAHAGGTLDIAFTGNGKIVTCGRDKQAKIWDGDGAQKALAKDFAEFPVTACLTHDGARFIVADWTGEVKVFNSADGKLAGKLVANPPSIHSRLTAAEKALAARTATLKKAQNASSTAAAQRDTASKALETARALVASTSSQKSAGAKGIKTAQTTLAQRSAERDAAAKDRDNKAKAVKDIEAAIAAAATDVEKKKQLATQLAAAKSALAGQQNILKSKQDAVPPAKKSVTDAKQSEANAVAKAATATKAMKQSETTRTAKAKSADETKAALATAQTLHTRAQKERQTWAAEQINLERHRKAEGRGQLAANASEAREAHTHLVSALAAATAATKAASAKLATANKEVTKLQALVKSELPATRTALASAQKAATQAKQALATRQKEEQAAKPPIAPAKQKFDAENASLTAFDAQLAEIKKRYLAALP